MTSIPQFWWPNVQHRNTRNINPFNVPAKCAMLSPKIQIRKAVSWKVGRRIVCHEDILVDVVHPPPPWTGTTWRYRSTVFFKRLFPGDVSGVEGCWLVAIDVSPVGLVSLDHVHVWIERWKPVVRRQVFLLCKMCWVVLEQSFSSSFLPFLSDNFQWFCFYVYLCVLFRLRVCNYFPFTVVKSRHAYIKKFHNGCVQIDLCPTAYAICWILLRFSGMYYNQHRIDVQ